MDRKHVTRPSSNPARDLLVSVVQETIARGAEPVYNLAVIDRADVPAGSFRYGQLASTGAFDVPADAWAVCTDCTSGNGTPDDPFRIVLVAHFLHSTEERVMETARNLNRSHAVTVVRPA